MKWHPGHRVKLPAGPSMPEGTEWTVYAGPLPENAEDIWAQVNKLVEKANERMPPKFWRNWWSGFKS